MPLVELALGAAQVVRQGKPSNHEPVRQDAPVLLPDQSGKWEDEPAVLESKN